MSCVFTFLPLLRHINTICLYKNDVLQRRVYALRLNHFKTILKELEDDVMGRQASDWLICNLNGCLLVEVFFMSSGISGLH